LKVETKLWHLELQNVSISLHKSNLLQVPLVLTKWQIFKFHLCAQCLQAFAIANPIPKFPKRFESHPHYYILFVLPPQINSSFSHNSTHFQNNIKIQMDFGQLQMQFSTFRFLSFTNTLNSNPHCAKLQMILEL
jgi:hypothetical protein